MPKKRVYQRAKRFLQSFIVFLLVCCLLPMSVYAASNQENREAGDSRLIFTVLDVGQALSVLVECDGSYMLYDGGDTDRSSYVVAYLKNKEITELDYMVASHYDSDHIAGLIGALNVFDVGHVLGPDYEGDTDLYRSFANAVGKAGQTIEHPSVGEQFNLGSAQVTVLAPSVEDEAPNNNSIAIKIVHGENSFLLTGDAEAESEEDMSGTGIDLRADVLVLGHHGSSTSTTEAFLDAVKPEIGIVSCADDNSYGYPHKEPLERLRARDIALYRTDKQGEIIAYSDGRTLTWNTDPCNDYSDGKSETAWKETASGISQEDRSKETVASEVTYILNTNSHKFHYPRCSSVDDMSERNKKEFYGSRDEAIAMGYDPCGRCKP